MRGKKFCGFLAASDSPFVSFWDSFIDFHFTAFPSFANMGARKVDEMF